MVLTNVLIVLLSILIILSLGRLFKRFLVAIGWRRQEGLESMAAPPVSASARPSVYTDPGLNNDPLYLAKLNAANISYLKDQVDSLNGLKEQVATLSSQTESNSVAVRGIGDQMTTSAQQLTGRDPNSKEPLPSATGLF
jgi:hypothetical protein